MDPGDKWRVGGQIVEQSRAGQQRQSGELEASGVIGEPGEGGALESGNGQSAATGNGGGGEGKSSSCEGEGRGEREEGEERKKEDRRQKKKKKPA